VEPLSRPSIFSLLAALVLLPGTAAVAQTITVSGNPAALKITSAVTGSQPTTVSNSSSTYTVVTPNPANRTYKITAQLTALMPAGVTLTATLAAPTGGTSVGPVALDMTARDMVTGIPKTTNSTQSITYQLSATVLAGVVTSTSRVVTLTVLRFP
jgi:hypothetical protein